ncbi:fused DSP-PTPase phosphatase/NAD kinase-like protein [Zhengella mangrovi]|nr:protein tyrosine phosphatase family protein [Zhengella mangrovi]
MKQKSKKSLLKAVMVPVAALAVGAALGGQASAQGKNPCAPAVARPANPCAPAQAKPANPCAPAAAAKTADAPAAAMPKGPYDTTTKYQQAVYGNEMPNIVKNYLRATPYIGTGGLIDPSSLGLLKTLGFKTIVNLNTADEGANEEAVLAKAAGLAYINMAVPTKAPTAEQIAQFAAIVENPENYPVLVHCESANRVGATWALYRASKGVPAEVAVEEGRAVGLKTSREAAVREQLGLQPL